LLLILLLFFLLGQPLKKPKAPHGLRGQISDMMSYFQDAVHNVISLKSVSLCGKIC